MLALPGNATLGQQPSAELRFYLPYPFYPPMRAMFIPGIYQFCGGKQYYKLPNGGPLNRAVELRMAAAF